MIKFHYGMILGADFMPSVRIMAVARIDVPLALRWAVSYSTWLGIVLTDQDVAGWKQGEMVTLAPEDGNIIVYEEPA